MRTYNVGLEIGGKQIKVGTIEGESSNNAQFKYSEEFLLSPGAHPISISLPLQKEPFSPEATRIFFDGLLPEGFMRRAIAGNMHVDEGDYLSMMSDYMKMLERMGEWEEKIDDMNDDDTLSVADQAYYLVVTTRVLNKSMSALE